MTTARRTAPALALLATLALLLTACGPTVASAASTATVEAQSSATPRAVVPPATAVETATPRAEKKGFVVALDAGHGGDESGAAAYGVIERDSNLDLAQRVGTFLAAAGVQVHYTRTDAGRASGSTEGGDTRNLTRADLQARVTGANRAGADVFVSLHSNGSGDTSMRGVEVYYDSRRPFADHSQRLAKELLDGTLRGLANAGAPSANRGIIDAACWRNFNGRCVGLFVLSPEGAVTGSGNVQAKEATKMPAALLETLFVSSPDDAALLKNDAVRTSVARGIADAILRYLGTTG